MKQDVLEKAQKMIERGEKPSVEKLSEELDQHPANIHRCLNALEKDREIETYTRELMGKKMRMVGVNR